MNNIYLKTFVNEFIIAIMFDFYISKRLSMNKGKGYCMNRIRQGHLCSFFRNTMYRDNGKLSYFAYN